MFEQRLHDLLSKLKSLNCQDVLIVNPMHVYYFTGFYSDPHERFMGLFLNEKKGLYLIVPALEVEHAHQVCQIPAKIVGYTDAEGPLAAIHGWFQNVTGELNLGVEKDVLTLSRCQLLEEAHQQLHYVDVAESIAQLRLLKSADEIKKLAAAAQLVDQVLEAGIKRVLRGMSERQLVAEIDYLAKGMGADAMAFTTMVLVGANAALPHGIPGSTPIEDGQFLLIDMGVRLNGYNSDITRTFMIGKANEKQKQVYHIVRQAEEQAIAAVRVGTTLAALDGVARETIRAAGYGDYFTHRLGHGLGMETHEYPSVHGLNHSPVVEGMVFTIEPGIYLPGWGGVRIEDDVVVQQSGAQVLTQFPKDLIEL
ncbi:M24 family metallopeptidase [Rubeoparvulum massiliense]|uniref:M24 family metallopeptidase n=1 Tax=Rubeoparvulum massiliense TaxID=1631346 RepID=UPI00065E5D49|nr:Xaa-Pro peptidase family protein [Rubeoparvulum massiliense]